VFVGEIDWHKWKQYVWSSSLVFYCFHLCQSISPTNTRLEDHMYCFHLCQSISPTNTRLEDHMYCFYLCQSMVRMIPQSCVCRGDWLTQMKAVRMILQSCLWGRLNDTNESSTYDPPVLFVGEIDWHKWK
jgi:hypothetical protein